MTTLVKKLHLDGWANFLSGLGSRKDKSQGAHMKFYRRLPDVELDQIYYGDGVAAAAIDGYPEDMTKAGFEVNGDDGKLYEAFRSLNGPSKFKEALTWTDLYGGALIVMDIEGAGSFNTPYNYELGKPIRSLRVYPRTRVELGIMAQVVDPESPYFEDYEFFKIRKVNGEYFTVHASRCLVFKSAIRVDPTAAGWTEYERYWGLSTMFRTYEATSSFGALFQGLTHLSQELAIGKYKLSNLEQLVSEGDYKAINRRMGAIDAQKSIVNGVFLGEGEDYTREQLSLSGVDGLVDRFMIFVATVWRYPVSRLFGRSAAGMNATGEGDQSNYYDRVLAQQTSRLLPVATKLMTVLNYNLKVLPVKDKIGITFSTLYPTDPQKDAAARNTIAQADAIYMDRGVLTREEVRKNRFVGGYSTETAVEDDGAFNLEE